MKLLYFSKSLLQFTVVLLASNLGSGFRLSPLKNEALALFDSPEVFLTISSEAGYEGSGNQLVLFDRRVELNWNNFETRQGDWVGLFDVDVTHSNFTNANFSSLAIEKVNADSPRGYHRSPHRYIRRNFDQLPPESERCVGFWIAYIRQSTNDQFEILESNCLKTFPTWMNELKPQIGDRPLHSIMIPGTHDAGSWTYYTGAPQENLIVRYSICQEDTIFEQLMHGIRYLDVRPSFYNGTAERFWINHGDIRMGPMIDLLHDVKSFVELTGEIVFMDFHNFELGFSSQEIHEEFYQFITKEIGSLFFPKSLSKNPTPNELWNAKKTVMVTYADSSMSDKYDLLWPYLIHAWGDKNDVQELHNYLNEEIPRRGCTGVFWSAMAEMTPTPIDIITKPLQGLRGFAQQVNLNMTYWFEQDSWYSKSMIVSTDFYLGNNIIQMAIKVNQNSAAC